MKHLPAPTFHHSVRVAFVLLAIGVACDAGAQAQTTPQRTDTPLLALNWKRAPATQWSRILNNTLRHNASSAGASPVAGNSIAQPYSSAFRDDLNAENLAMWRKSGPWSNHGVFRNAWHPDNIVFNNGMMTLRLDNVKNDGKDFTGAEIKTSAKYGYGRIEARMKPARQSGVITSLFTYVGPASGSAHHEIDIEFLGNDTTKLAVAYYTDGKIYSAATVPLGFDAADAFHNYAFEWTQKSIKWFVDSRLVFTATSASGPIPSLPGHIMANLWATINADGWAGAFNYPGKPITAQYDWIRYTPLRPDGSPVS